MPDSENPLFAVNALPQFDRLEPDHVTEALPVILETAERRLQILENEAIPSWSGLMEPLLELEAPLEFAWGLVQHMLSVMNTNKWRAVHDQMQPRVVAFCLRLQQSESLYGHLNALRACADWERLDHAQKRIVESILRDAELSGVGLHGNKRTQFNTIQESLAREATAFSNAVLDASKGYALTLTKRDEIAGVEPSLLRAASASARSAGTNSAPETGPWRISLETPLYIPFMEQSQRRDLREILYRAYVTRASSGIHDNRARLLEILRLRGESARLLGYESYAERSLKSKMADSVATVEALLESLRMASFQKACDELRELETFAKVCDPSINTLHHWDIAYYAEQLRKERFGISTEILRSYFPFPVVLDGLFSLCHKLFGITITAADGDISVWHPDVRCFRIEEAGTPLALFYLDPYSRPENKRGGAWMNPARSRHRHKDGSYDLPAAYLVCNQTRPDPPHPSLMTFDEVTTLFHEFGHALQHLLTTIDDPRAAGINNIEWDAVEIASQFMENWCFHWPTVQAMTRHSESGAALPLELFEPLRAARTFRAATAMVRQLTFAALDIELHHRFVADGDRDAPDAVKQHVASRFLPMPPLDEDRFLCSFSHIFSGGYAAGYYSYKWAEVMAADVYAAFEEAGVEDDAVLEATGRRLRNTLLALGGGMHPMDVFKAFRGREPDPNALLRQAGLCK